MQIFDAYVRYLDTAKWPAVCNERVLHATIILSEYSFRVFFPNYWDGGFMKQRIVGFYQDELGDWVARLACGHGQHVRHNPPWQNRAWVITDSGRNSRIGHMLNCKKCSDRDSETNR